MRLLHYSRDGGPVRIGVRGSDGKVSEAEGAGTIDELLRTGALGKLKASGRARRSTGMAGCS